MKKKIYALLLFLFFILILCFPRQALQGSCDGLLLWFNTVLPTLLPFIILTNLIIRIDAVHYLTFFFSPVLKRLFSISEYGCYSMMIGFLCGYPMGAKVTADLLKEQRISRQEGQHLLAVCNNVSPMFFISYVVIQSLKLPQYRWPLLFILYFPPLLYAFLTREKSNTVIIKQEGVLNKKPKGKKIKFEMVDICIMDGFETITKLGGYIILFSIIAKMVTALPYTATITENIIIGTIEITNGIHKIAVSDSTIQEKVMLITTLNAFGGLSCIAQTKSMIQDTSLSIKQYIKSKLVIVGITFVTALLFCMYVL